MVALYVIQKEMLQKNSIIFEINARLTGNYRERIQDSILFFFEFDLVLPALNELITYSKHLVSQREFLYLPSSCLQILAKQ